MQRLVRTKKTAEGRGGSPPDCTIAGGIAGPVRRSGYVVENTAEDFGERGEQRRPKGAAAGVEPFEAARRKNSPSLAMA